jgi:tetrahydromethanopterin S-methyltransferase subunit G
MAVDERRRAELYERMSATLGPEATATMFDLLPPPGDRGATAGDVETLSGRMDAAFVEVDHRFQSIDQRFEQIDRRFEQVDQRFEQVDQRFEQVDQRFDHLEEKLDVSFDALRYELLAAFRGELVTAVSGQTRAVIVAVATATFGIGGLAVTLAQLL